MDDRQLYIKPEEETDDPESFHQEVTDFFNSEASKLVDAFNTGIENLEKINRSGMIGKSQCLS